jgi:hypothetical protein
MWSLANGVAKHATTEYKLMQSCDDFVIHLNAIIRLMYKYLTYEISEQFQQISVK